MFGFRSQRIPSSNLNILKTLKSPSNSREKIISRHSSNLSRTASKTIGNKEAIARVLGVSPSHVKALDNQGQFGEVFVVTGVTDRLRHAKSILRESGSFYVPVSTPPTGQSTFFVKITDTLYEGVHEARVFQYLRAISRKELLTCKGVGTRLLDIRQHIPTYYGGGVLDGQQYIQIMQFVRGRPLNVSTDASPKVLRLVQDAILSLWSAGIVHGDLHPNNMFLQRDARGTPVRAILLDFGFALKLPSSLKRVLVSRRCTPYDALFHPALETYIKKQQQGFRRYGFHWNSTIMRNIARLVAQPLKKSAVAVHVPKQIFRNSPISVMKSPFDF